VFGPVGPSTKINLPDYTISFDQTIDSADFPANGFELWIACGTMDFTVAYLYEWPRLRLNLGSTLSFTTDNFQVAVIPEPSTYALLSGGMCALVGLRRRYS
jgi:hypothetical protein